MATNIVKIESTSATQFSPVNPSQTRSKPVLPRPQTPQQTRILAKMIVLTPRRCPRMTSSVDPVTLPTSSPVTPTRSGRKTEHSPERLGSIRDLSIRYSCPFFFENKVFRLFQTFRTELQKTLILILSLFSFAF